MYKSIMKFVKMWVTRYTRLLRKNINLRKYEGVKIYNDSKILEN